LHGVIFVKLNVEPEQRHVAVLHDVILAFAAYEPLFLARGDGAEFDERFERDDLRANEPFFKIRMDLARGLRRFGAARDRPRADLLRPGGQEADESKQAIARLDKLIEAGFFDAELL